LYRIKLRDLAFTLQGILLMPTPEAFNGVFTYYPRSMNIAANADVVRDLLSLHREFEEHVPTWQCVSGASARWQPAPHQRFSTWLLRSHRPQCAAVIPTQTANPLLDLGNRSHNYPTAEQTVITIKPLPYQ
jgi:hypothetical protein